MLHSLFDHQDPGRESRQIFEMGDGQLWYYPNWLSQAQAQSHFCYLSKHCRWQQSTIRIAGRDVKIPRLNAWYGEPQARYQYSGTLFNPLPWNRALTALRLRLHQQLQCEGIKETFNSALVNCYRDGSDSVAWHADDEPELGPAPLIASISLGASRRFLLKRRDGNKRLKLELEHGSLLLMLPPLQRYWLHALPKTRQAVTSRINVTYRAVFHSQVWLMNQKGGKWFANFVTYIDKKRYFLPRNQSHHWDF